MDQAMNEYELIEQIEDLITGAKQTMFSDKITISKDEILDLLYYLKAAIKQRDQEDEAKSREFLKIMQQVKDQEKKEEKPLVVETSQASLDEVKELKLAALKYADSLLEEIEGKLRTTLKTIKENREELKQ